MYVSAAHRSVFEYLAKLARKRKGHNFHLYLYIGLGLRVNPLNHRTYVSFDDDKFTPKLTPTKHQLTCAYLNPWPSSPRAHTITVFIYLSIYVRDNKMYMPQLACAYFKPWPSSPKQNDRCCLFVVLFLSCGCVCDHIYLSSICMSQITCAYLNP